MNGAGFAGLSLDGRGLSIFEQAAGAVAVAVQPEKLKRNNLGLQDKLLSEIGGQVLGNTVCYFVERLLTKAKCINSSGKVRWKEQGALKS